MTENDLQTLLNDPETKDVVTATFLLLYRRLFAVARDEGVWGPANETLSQVRKKLEPHFERISELKRSKK